MKPKTSEALIGLAIILITTGIAIVYGGWVSHALVGLIGLILLILTALTGAMVAGKIEKSWRNRFNLHRKAAIYFGSLMLGTFLSGLWMKLEDGEPQLSSVHGILGLIIILMASLQIVPTFMAVDRTRIKTLHKALGYSLAPILFLDASWGLYTGVVAGTKSLVLAHSLSGSLVALSLIWIMAEIAYPTKTGILRARTAGYLAAFLVIAGCWIAGGYYYLSAYGQKVKPVILSSSSPWAHQVVLETKEHVFLFLPVIILALSATLTTIDKEVLLQDARARKAILIVASLALFMVLMMFIMGVVVSNTAKTGMGV